jgi:hypothetical protein
MVVITGGRGGDRACTIGGFNVSNFMGIKRRMIDISNKNYANFEYFCFSTFFRGFRLLTFLGAFFKTGINEFEIIKQFCFFVYPY